MKNYLLILLFSLSCSKAFSQFSIKGIVIDNQREKLQYVKITSLSTKQIYRTDVHGEFVINSTTTTDSLKFSYDGYETVIKVLKSTEFNSIILKSLPSSVFAKKSHLSSMPLKNKESTSIKPVWNESYKTGTENEFLNTANATAISFSANINRASYSNVRRFINYMDGPVPPAAVRIEEMLNYFNFHFKEPKKDSVFNSTSFITSCPWNQNNQLLFLNISARKINTEHLPPNHLVLLIDVSGSMDMPNKLPLLKTGYRLLIKNLRAIDSVSIITYGEQVTIITESVSGNEKDSLIKAINSLTADGPTPGEAGIRMAYKIAKKHFIKEGNNRILLGADGDFNVGINKEEDLKKMVEEQKKSGVYLTCLGVGIGNYKDSKLYVLSQIGNGNFAYLDNEQEAEKVLVSELTQTLFTVADNVFINVKFNPAYIQSFRLIGYDNDRTSISDTSSLMEGGEIGSGNSLMAVFEIIPNKDSVVVDANIAAVKINYSLPGQSKLLVSNYNCKYQFQLFKDAVETVKKAACVVLFSMKLKESEFAEKISWKTIKNLCTKNFTATNFAETEFLDLVNKAQKLYKRKKFFFF